MVNLSPQKIGLFYFILLSENSVGGKNINQMIETLFYFYCGFQKNGSALPRTRK